MIKIYIGQFISLMQLLLRYGYIDSSLQDRILLNDKYYCKIAKNILQFKDESSEIKLNIIKLSVEVIFIHKAHCEVAGRGIDCLWGVSKILFYKENTCLDNDKRVNNLKPRIKKILKNMRIKKYQKYSRQALRI